MSNVTPIKLQKTAPVDYSTDVTIHLNHAHAVADLVQALYGSATDGSESKLDELCTGTLYSAMDCIMRSVEAANALQSRREVQS